MSVSKYVKRANKTASRTKTKEEVCREILIITDEMRHNTPTPPRLAGRLNIYRGQYATIIKQQNDLLGIKR